MDEQLSLIPDGSPQPRPGLRVVEGGDLFASPCQTLVNPVNCIGVMGAGLALEFRRRFPAVYRDYRRLCREGELRVGEPHLHVGAGPWVLNFPTKHHWRDPARLEWVQAGLAHLCAHARAWGIRSLAVPALGCGLGQLDWAQVRPLLERELAILQVPVELYPPR